MEFNATFFVSIISFLVFTYLMNKIFYAPISKITNERQGIISNLLTEADESKTQADKLLKERDEKLLKSSEESRKIIADKVEKANNRANVLTINAKNASVEQIAIKKEELIKNEAEIKGNLASVAESLADDITSKILG